MTEAKKYSGSGTYHGYHVEIRIKPEIAKNAIALSEDCLVTKEWTRVPVEEVPKWGVHNDLWYWNSEADMYPFSKQLRLMPFETAMAIAASVAAGKHSWKFSLEFRLVQVKVEYQHYHQDIKACDAFTFDQLHKAREWTEVTDHLQTNGGAGAHPTEAKVGR